MGLYFASCDPGSFNNSTAYLNSRRILYKDSEKHDKDNDNDPIERKDPLGNKCLFQLL